MRAREKNLIPFSGSGYITFSSTEDVTGGGEKKDCDSASTLELLSSARPSTPLNLVRSGGTLALE